MNNKIYTHFLSNEFHTYSRLKGDSHYHGHPEFEIC